MIGKVFEGGNIFLSGAIRVRDREGLRKRKDLLGSERRENTLQIQSPVSWKPTSRIVDFVLEIKLGRALYFIVNKTPNLCQSQLVFYAISRKAPLRHSGEVGSIEELRGHH
jgi:hypothetical protein